MRYPLLKMLNNVRFIEHPLNNGGYIELGYFPQSWGLGVQVDKPLEITLSFGPVHLWWMV